MQPSYPAPSKACEAMHEAGLPIHRTVVAGTTEHTAPANRTYYPALDGLRAVAFLMVFFQHYHQMPWGWTGVNVFFVLSGFLITGILWDTRDRPHRARDFYIRRTLRIFPLYYGIFLALLLTTPFLHWDWTKRWVLWPLYLGNFLRFMGHGGLTTAQQTAGDAQLLSRTHGTLLYLGHFWSLCVEEQFYLVWPWVVFWTRSRKKLIALCSVVAIVMPLLRVLAQHHAPAWMIHEELTYRLTPFQLDSLLLGGLLALLWRGAHRDLLLLISKWTSSICALAVAAGSIWIAVTFWPRITQSYRYPQWHQTWGLSFVDVFSAALIICALQPGSIVYRILDVRPLRALGRISYGAYVFHDIFHTSIAHRVHVLATHSHLIAREEGKLTLVIAFLVTLLLATLSYRFFETPFLNLKARWSGAPTRRAAHVHAA